MCVWWQNCSTQTRNWYIHWPLYVCLVTELQYRDQKLVHSLASLCVSGDKIAEHRPEIGTFIGLFMCVWWQNSSTQTRNWYIHWPLYVCLVTKLQYTDQKLVHSLGSLCVSGDKIAVHRPEIGTFIGLFMGVWWQNCRTQTRNWYIHWPVYVCLVTKLQNTDQKLVHLLASLCVSGDKIAEHRPEIGTFIGLFMCVWWQNCSTQTRNWYIHWPLYVCLVTKLQNTDQKLVHSLACLCVSGDKIAVHRPEIGTFIGFFMCVWWQNCSTQTRNWYIHWLLYVCLVTKLQYTDQKLVHSLASLWVSGGKIAEHRPEIGTFIGLFMCVWWQNCSTQTRNWYIHWPLYVCLVTKLQNTDQKLVHSLASLCVSGDKIAVHRPEICTFIGLFMCLWWQNCST